MWISCRFPIIGLHFLLLTHITHTFVLLTANMDDVKKLARKLVSESLAETIVGIIARATKDIGNDDAEGDKTNAEDSHHLSEENTKYNIGGRGVEVPAEESSKSREENNVPKKQAEEIKNESKSQSISNELNNVPEPYIETNNKKKAAHAAKSVSPKRYAKVERNKAKRYAYPVQTEHRKRKPEYSEKEIKHNKKIVSKKRPSYDDDFDGIVPATRTRVSSNERARLITREPYRLIANISSFEVNEVTDAETNIIFDATHHISDDISVFDQIKAADGELTTRKAVYEFEQYENYYYPKSKLVSNGPVELKSAPSPKMADERSRENGTSIVNNKRNAN